MSNYAIPEGKDPQLWQLARKRASFKSHLATYLVVNAGLWVIWYFTGAETYNNSIPWPAWSMFGWGIGVVSHFASAYGSNSANSVEKEYDKLKQKQSN